MSCFGSEGRRGFLKAVVGAAAALAASGRRAMSEENEVITAVTFIRGIEGMERELEAHLLTLSAPTREEPGCVMHDLYRSADVKNHPEARSLGQSGGPRS